MMSTLVDESSASEMCSNASLVNKGSSNNILEDYDDFDETVTNTGNNDQDSSSISICWETATGAQKEIFRNKEDFEEYATFRRMKSREKRSSVSCKLHDFEQIYSSY